MGLETLSIPELLAKCPTPIIVGIGDEDERAQIFLSSEEKGTLFCVNPIYAETQINFSGDKAVIFLNGRLDHTALPDHCADCIQCNLVLSSEKVVDQYGRFPVSELILEAQRIAKPGVKLEILDTLFLAMMAATPVLNLLSLNYEISRVDEDFIRLRSPEALKVGFGANNMVLLTVTLPE